MRRKKIEFLCLFYGSISVICYFIFTWPDNLELELKRAYIISVISLVIQLSIIIWMHARYTLDMFEPFVPTSVIYLMIFSICPLIDIQNNDTVIYGFDPMSGAVKGTIIFIISYLAFVVGYIQKKKYSLLNYRNFSSQKLEPKREKILIKVAYFLWFLGLIGTLIYITGNGLSLRYIFSLGKSGTNDIVQNGDSALGFIGMLTFTMITATVYILFLEKSRIIKTAFYLVTLICLIVRGFRSIIIILLVAPFIYFYVKRGKRPSIGIMVIAIGMFCIMVGIVGFIRNDLRAGYGISLEGFDINTVVQALMGNFRRYNIFYGMVEALPAKHGYTFGKNYIYTLVMIIPRIIWPGKPQPVMYDILRVSTSELIASTGAAWPNIGEYYMEFGTIGCIVMMYLLGRFFSRLRLSYNSSKTTCHSLMGYSVFIPSLITVIAYGYTPSTAYMLLFLLIPVIVLKYFDR